MVVSNSADDVRRHFAAIVESSEDAIISKNLDGIILSWNQAAHRIFGYEAAEVIGKPVTILIPSDHQNEEPEIIARIRRGEKVEHYETIRQRKDGRLINISLTVSPIKDSEGTIVGASKIARDITEQKQNEQILIAARRELADLNDELERRVAERTASLQEAVAQLEEFSYCVSHDLRSPVRAIQGYTKAVLEDYGHLLDETGRDYLNRVVRSSSRMDKLILDVLVYSRLARSQIELEPIQLEPLIRDLIHEYMEKCSPRPKIRTQGLFGSVMAHESSLSQVLSNLISNAAKFVPVGTTPEVEIRGERFGEFLRLSVTDNGIGILPEHQSRLFRMFERLHQNPHYDGTGIGLAIVRKAVEKMGGQIGVKSDGRTGTTFWVELRAEPGTLTPAS